MFKNGFGFLFVFAISLACLPFLCIEAIRHPSSPLSFVQFRPSQYSSILQRKEADGCLRVFQTQRTLFREWFLDQVRMPFPSSHPHPFIKLHTIIPFHTLWDKFMELIAVFLKSGLISVLPQNLSNSSFHFIFLQHIHVFKALQEWENLTQMFQEYWNQLQPCPVTSSSSSSSSISNTMTTSTELSCHPYMQRFHRFIFSHTAECPYIHFLRSKLQLLVSNEMTFPLSTLFSSPMTLHDPPLFSTWLSTLHQLATDTFFKLSQGIQQLEHTFHPNGPPSSPSQVSKILSNIVNLYLNVTQPLEDLQHQVQWFNPLSPPIQFFQTCIQALQTHTNQRLNHALVWKVSPNRAWMAIKRIDPRGGICYQVCIKKKLCLSESKPNCLSIQSQEENDTKMEETIQLERII